MLEKSSSVINRKAIGIIHNTKGKLTATVNVIIVVKAVAKTCSP